MFNCPCAYTGAREQTEQHGSVSLFLFLRQVGPDDRLGAHLWRTTTSRRLSYENVLPIRPLSIVANMHDFC